MFSGNIKESIGQLVNLRVLELSLNKFSGDIPDSFSNLSKFEIFILDNNDLSGAISQSMCDKSLGVLRADCDEIVCSCCSDCCNEKLGCVSFDIFGELWIMIMMSTITT